MIITIGVVIVTIRKVIVTIGVVVSTTPMVMSAHQAYFFYSPYFFLIAQNLGIQSF